MFLKSGFACVLAWLALSLPASAQPPADVVAGKLDRALRQCPQVTIFDDVDARVDGSSVVLTGKVTAPAKRAQIEKRVASLDGVRELRNEISVLPPVPEDDELRRRVAKAIYGNPTFWPYAAMSNPPIHIIVNHGRVTLQGVVQSNVERQLARSLATGFAAFEVKNELKTDAELRAELERIGQ